MNRKYFGYRALIIATVLVGILFIFSNPDNMSMLKVLGHFGLFITLCGVCYLKFHNLPKKEIDKIMMVEFIKDKFGIDLNEE